MRNTSPRSPSSRGLLAAATLLLLAMFAAPGAAQAGLFEVNLAATGCANMSFLGEPGEKTFRGAGVDSSYPDWMGIGGCFGGFFEPRLTLGPIIVGVETGVIYSVAQASGEFAIGAASDEVTLETTDLIIPIHAKVRLPFLPFFGVNLGLGADISLPLTADINAGDLGSAVAIAERETTTYLGFQAGFEFSIPSVGLSIPLDLRGRYNLDLEDSYDGRFTQLSAPATFIPNWRWQLEIHLGVAYSFLVF